MPAFSYRLTFAGVPFLLDEAAVFRMNQEHHPSEVTDQQPIRRYQPEADLIDELNRVIPFQYLNDFAPVPAFTGKNLDALAWSNEGNASPLPTVRIGDWYYPTGCSRWSVFRMLASSSQVKEMLRVTGGSANPSRCDAATFHVECKPQGALNTNFVYSIDTSMFMLPPRPLNEHGKKFDGLYLVTLVDERYLYRSLPVTLLPQLGTSWQGLIDQIQQVIPAYPITLESAVQAVYQAPALDSQLWTQWESLGVLLDIVAANIGRVPVRRFDGSIRLYTFAESQAKAATNRGNAATVIRTAGGDIFQSGTTLAAGNLTSAKNAVVPNFVDVSFPKYVVGDDPVPHFLDARYQSPRRSMWFEDSFGSVFTEKVPIASGGVNVSGLTGVGEISVRDTAKAFISGEVAVSGTPINVSGLRSLAMQIAQDYYNSQAAVALDEVFPGTVSWDPDGINDIVWTYSARARGAYTRVLRGASWSRVLREFQHESPASSGYNYGQKGVGGHGVAQTIRDSFGSSGTFVGLSGRAVSGSTVSGSPASQFSGGIFSGSISTTLSQTLLSGQFVARFTGISHFPTQNRWWGSLPGNSGPVETILFEGTSGGIAGAYSGNLVQIVARGQFGTIQRQHDTGAFLKQVLPDAGYGINLTTYEKGQFIYPSDWTSGGVQGVNVVPQVQTVRAVTGTGILVSGLVYYSGRVQVYDPTQPVASAWIGTDYAWVIERNNDVVSSGTRYVGQFLGFSPNVSGVATSGNRMVPAPIYAVSVAGDATTLTVRDSYGASGTFYGLSGQGISGAALSGAASGIAQFSGGIFSGSVSTVLAENLGSGSLLARFADVGYFPTQNRWWGSLVGSGPSATTETVLFEGTSGGVCSFSGGFSGNYVGIVARGQFDTTQRQYASGDVVRQVFPDFGYDLSLITHEKGQFVYPQEYTQGSPFGVNIVPQTQTIQVVDPTGFTVSGVRYQSGRVQVYDSTKVSGGAWISTDYVWAVERNGNAIDSGRIEGQFVGYSPFVSGRMIPSPVYATTVGNAYVLSVQDDWLASGPNGTAFADQRIIFSGTDSVNRPTFITQIVGSLPSGLGLVSGTSLSGQSAVYFNDVGLFPTQNRWRGLVFLSGLAGSGGNREVVLFNGTSGGVSSGTPGIGGYVTIVQRGLEGTTQIEISGNPFVAYRSPDLWSGVNQITFEESQFAYPGLGSGGTTSMRVVPQTQTVYVWSASGTPMLSGFIYYSGAVVYYQPWERFNNAKWTFKNVNVWVIDRYYAPNQVQISGASRILSGTLYAGELVGYSPANSGRAAAAPIYAVNPMPEHRWRTANTQPVDASTTVTSPAFEGSFETIIPFGTPNIGYGLFIENGRSDLGRATQMGMMFPEPDYPQAGPATRFLLGGKTGIGGVNVWEQSFKGLKRFPNGAWAGSFYVGNLSGSITTYSQQITSVTNANPAVVTTDGAHGIVTGDTVLIDFVNDMPGINGRRYAPTVTGASTFTIPVDLSSGNGFPQSASFGWMIKVNDGAGRVPPVDGGGFESTLSGLFAGTGPSMVSYIGGERISTIEVTGATGVSKTATFIVRPVGDAPIFKVTGTAGSGSQTISVGSLVNGAYASTAVGNFYAGLYVGGAGFVPPSLGSGPTLSIP